MQRSFQPSTLKQMALSKEVTILLSTLWPVQQGTNQLGGVPSTRAMGGSCVVRRSSGCSAVVLLCSHDMLPADFALESWGVVEWEGEVERICSQQLEQKVLTEAQAATNLLSSQNAYYDQHKQPRTASQQLHGGGLVLVHQTKKADSRNWMTDGLGRTGSERSLTILHSISGKSSTIRI